MAVRGMALAGLAVAVVAAAPAWAAPDCSKDPRIPAVAKAWKDRAEPPPFVITLADAPCFRNALLSQLSLGPIVGYKIGVYSKGARAAYNTDKPAVGVLHRDMLQPEGKPVSASFGFTPLAEADFLAVVGDEGLNDARTPEEAYEHISAYRPFIEMPDLFGEKTNIARLTALDVGARKGAMGPEFTLPRTREARLALRDMIVETTIETPQGTRTSRVQAKELQGDLMQVVLDARDLLRTEGIRLKKGDVLSLGTLTPYHPPVAGEKFTVTYRIGDATYTIRQDFTP
jgi:2-oxo-hept-3-ene-1,7-dioate hydratase